MVLFALSCFGLLLFLWLSFGGPIPLKPKGYQFKVAFPEATQLGRGGRRARGGRAASARCARRRSTPSTPTARSRRSSSTRKFAPIARDARAILRQKTLLGETYVELTPGNKRRRRTVPDGGCLADARVAKTVELDEIFQALDPETRASVPHLAAGPGQGGRRPRARPQRRARQPARLRRRRRRPARRARRPVAGGRAARAQHRRRVRRAHAERGPAAQPGRQRRRHASTPPRASRRRWPRRSGSSRPSSTSPRPRSQRLERFSKDTDPLDRRTCARRRAT